MISSSGFSANVGRRSWRRLLVVGGCLLLGQAIELNAFEPTMPPSWTKDLVLYQLTVERFTSPNGAQCPDYDGIIHIPGQDGSGTISELTAKLDYLDSLGVTALWIESLYWYQWASQQEHPFGPHPFRPDRPHPRHGSEQQLKAFIQAAHQRGLKVLMGMVPTYLGRKSPLLTENPDWFVTMLTKGRPLYNYQHPEFRRWWVDTWVSWVLDLGIDGFRVDGPGYTPQQDPKDIMAFIHEVATRCAAAGKPILVMVEGWQHGYHLLQGWEEEDTLERSDMETFELNTAGGSRFHTLVVSMHDYADYRIRGSRFKFGYAVVFGTRIPILFMGEEFDATRRNTPEAIEGGSGLLAQWLDWGDLKMPTKRAFLEDSRRILNVRRNNADILHYDRQVSRIATLRFTTADTGAAPSPYVRYVPGVGAIVVAGNDGKRSREFEIAVPIEKLGLEGDRFRVTDLWTGVAQVVDAVSVSAIRMTVAGDNVEGGGVRAVRIDPIQSHD